MKAHSILTLAVSAVVLMAAPALATELKFAIATDVTSMDPQYANITGNVQVSRHMFESMTDLDPEGRLVPRLAESWRRVEPNVWLFKLRRNVKFQDGSALTAEDVVFALGRPATLTASPATLNGFLKDITKAEAVDALTVRLTTASPLAVLPNYLAMVPIVSKKLTQGLKPEDFETGRGMVGTGPYRFVKFLRSDRVELQRNEGYWGNASPFDKVTIRIMPNNPARTAALLSGEVDAIAAVPAADMARIKQNPGFTFYSKPLARHTFWVLNQYSEQLPGATDHGDKPLATNPFKDVRVRRAFSKAIDREAIGSRVMEGLGVPTQNPVPSTMFGYNSALQPEKLDLDGAKKLMADAGLPNCFKFSLFARSDSHPTDSNHAQAVGQMLSRLGCKVAVEVLPTSVFFTRGNKLELPMLLLASGVDGGDLGVMLEYLFSNPTNNPFRKVNMQTYDSPQFWKPLREALASSDDLVRERKYREVTQVLRDEVGVIPTELMVGTWASRKGLLLTPRVDERTYAYEAVTN